VAAEVVAVVIAVEVAVAVAIAVEAVGVPIVVEVAEVRTVVVEVAEVLTPVEARALTAATNLVLKFKGPPAKYGRAFSFFVIQSG
jgi:hypothetical protein